MTAVPHWTYNSRPMANLDLPRRALLALVATLFAGVALAQSGPIEDLDKFPRGKLEIDVTKKAPLSFEVWLADTPARQSQGLMFVRSLPELRGMLFVYQQPKQISMWMKNTFIPLDMVFIDEKGRIQSISEHAVPHSLQTINSTRPALAILEIGGGEARRLGLKPGQKVSHPALTHH